MRPRLSCLAPFVACLVLLSSLAGLSNASSSYTLVSDSLLVPIPVVPEVGLDDPASETWRTPIGISDFESLTEVVCYSAEGHAIRFNVDDKREEYGVRIKVQGLEAFHVPEGLDLMLPVDHNDDLFLAFAGESLYELDAKAFEQVARIDIGFEPVYHSNLWNRWSQILPVGEVLHAMATGNAVGLYALLPPNPQAGEDESRSVYETLSLDDLPETRGARVVGEPIVLNRWIEENGSLVVVPTDRGVAGIALDLPTTGGLISNASFGEQQWYVSYDDIEARWGGSVAPIQGRPISLVNDHILQGGKDRILLACEGGRVFSMSRSNGTLQWTLDLGVEDLDDLELTGIWPTWRDLVVVTGRTGGDGYIGVVSPEEERVYLNGAAQAVIPSVPAGRPQYTYSSRQVVVDGEGGRVLLLTEDMELDAVLEVPGGTANPTTYAGNIINNVGSSQGNYLAAITTGGELYLRATSGVVIPEAPQLPEPSPGALLVAIVTDYGNITIELFMGECPGTAGNFKELVEDGFYDGLTFHRVIEDFMIQGGCPNGDGTGGPGYTIPGEEAALALEHDFGAISMANAGSPDTAGSQFFIVVNERGAHHLDGGYAVFGRVVDGMEVVLGLSAMPVVDNGQGEMSRPAFTVHMRTVVVLDNQPPVVPAFDGCIVVLGEATRLDGSAVTDNVGIANWTWTFEQGGETLSLHGPVQEFTFLEPGEFNVTLTVSDGAGNTAEGSTVVRVLPSEVEEGDGSRWEDADGSRTMVTVLLVITLVIVALLVSRPRRGARGLS